MKILITREFDTTSDAIAFLMRPNAAPAPQSDGAPAIVAPAAAPESRGRGRPAGVTDSKPRKRRNQPEAPAVTPAPETTAAAAPGEPAAQSAPGASATIEQAREALTDLFTAKGLATAQEVMSRYGAKRLQDMKPEQFAIFAEHARGVIAGTVPV